MFLLTLSALSSSTLPTASTFNLTDMKSCASQQQHDGQNRSEWEAHTLNEALINAPCEINSFTSLKRIRILTYGTSKSSMWEFVYFMYLFSYSCVCLTSPRHTVEEAVGFICILILSCRSPSCGPREMRNTTEQ